MDPDSPESKRLHGLAELYKPLWERDPNISDEEHAEQVRKAAAHLGTDLQFLELVHVRAEAVLNTDNLDPENPEDKEFYQALQGLVDEKLQDEPSPKGESSLPDPREDPA